MKKTILIILWFLSTLVVTPNFVSFALSVPELDPDTVTGSFTITKSVDWVCWTSNWQFFTVEPITNLCSVWLASYVVSSWSIWEWTCSSLAIWSIAKCQTSLTATAVNWTCWTSNWQSFTVAPTTNLCATWNTWTVSWTGPWTWTCSWINSWATATCQAGLTVGTWWTNTWSTSTWWSVWWWSSWGWSSSVRDCITSDYICKTETWTWKWIWNLASWAVCYDRLNEVWKECLIAQASSWTIVVTEASSWTTNQTNTWKLNQALQENWKINPDWTIEFCWIIHNPVLFTDIDKSFAKDYITFLANRWIVKWYQNQSWSLSLNFQPKNHATRAEFLKMVLWSNCVQWEDDYSSKVFSDIKAWTWEARVVNKWLELWVISKDNKLFRPTDPISRAEALKILLNVYKIETQEVTKSSFSDVSWWAIRYVEKAKNLWIIAWNDKFRPGDLITREESSKMIVNVMELK